MNILDKINDPSQQEIYKKYLSKSLPFDVIGFGQDLGLEIKESDQLDDGISGFIKKRTGTEKVVICVNSLHHPNRQRFTIAHEIGHYFLHNNKLEKGLLDGTSVLMRKNNAWSTLEKEANEFAAELLMPESIFTKLWSDKTPVHQMALKFYVSESAIITRAKLLKLSNENYSFFI